MSTAQPAAPPAVSNAAPTAAPGQSSNAQVANLIAHLARASNNGEAANPIQQMLARMPPNESASVIAQVSVVFLFCSEYKPFRGATPFAGRRHGFRLPVLRRVLSSST
jgi:hypothetical protein